MQPIAEIRLDNLRHNYHIIQELVSNIDVMAVVKADGYGHGAVKVAQTLQIEGIAGFCVALIPELIELRENGIYQKILHFGRFSKDDLPIFENPKNICTINCEADIHSINEYKQNTDTQITAHIKFDTGMNRMGVNWEDAERYLKLISQSKGIILTGAYSHFSTSEEKDTSFMQLQLERFKQTIDIVQHYCPNVESFHIANSAGILQNPDNHLSMVRPGLSLFGVTILNQDHSDLRPVMQLKAPITLIKHVKKGEPIGYNQQFITTEDIEMGIVQIGYADGVPMEFTNQQYLSFHDQLLPVIGKVSMDMININCNGYNVKENDLVTLWGADCNQVADVSQGINLSPYVLLTGVSKRVKRIYIDE